MSTTLDRPTAPAPVAPPESSRRAWVAVLLAPFVVEGAFILGFAIEAWWGAELIALTLSAIPVVGGFVLGVRSARTGNRSGALAAATATAEALFIAMFLSGANVIEFKSDGTSALFAAAIAVAGFAVAEIVLDRVSRRTRSVDQDDKRFSH